MAFTSSELQRRTVSNDRASQEKTGKALPRPWLRHAAPMNLRRRGTKVVRGSRATLTGCSFGTHGCVPARLSLEFGIDFCAQEHREGGNQEPDERKDDQAHGSERLVKAGRIRNVPGQDARRGKPQRCCDQCPPAHPRPSCMRAAGTISIKNKQ